jgi:hypothetical protein
MTNAEIYYSIIFAVGLVALGAFEVWYFALHRKRNPRDR